MIRGTVLASLLLLSGQYNPAGPVFAHSGGLNPCLVSAWPMNEGTGLTLHDTSGHSNTATIDTGATVVWQSNPGLPGITPSWTAGTGNAPAASAALTSFSNTQPFSVSFWMSTTSGSEIIFLSTLDPSAGFKGWEIDSRSSTSFVDFTLVNTAGSNQLDEFGSTNIHDGNLHYIVATYDGTSVGTGVKLYVDGVAEIQTTNLNTLTATSASAIPVTIGNRSGGSFGAFGPLAFAEVYNCVLTPTQITTYHAAGPGIY